MCLRGVERRLEVEKSGVAMMINEIGINFRIGKRWGGVNKCGEYERCVAFLDPLSKRGALTRTETIRTIQNHSEPLRTIYNGLVP